MWINSKHRLWSRSWLAPSWALQPLCLGSSQPEAAGCDQARQGVPVPQGVLRLSEDVEQLMALA